MSLLQLGLVVCLYVGFVSSASIAENERETIISERDDVDDSGVQVHDRRMVDPQCRYQNNTNTKAGGSKTEILDDYVVGKGVILQNSSKDCLVRDIPDDEKKEASNCVNGMVQREEDKPDKEEVKYIQSDKEMSDEEREELPNDIQLACKDRKIYKLVPSTTGNVENDGAESRAKRALLGLCYRIIYYYDCRYECYSYFFGRYCYQYCIRYAYFLTCWW